MIPEVPRINPCPMVFSRMFELRCSVDNHFYCFIAEDERANKQNFGCDNEASDVCIPDDSALICGALGQAFDIEIAEDTSTPLKKCLPSAPMEFQSPKGTFTYRIRYVEGKGKWVVSYTARVKHEKKGKRKQLGSYSSSDKVCIELGVNRISDAILVSYTPTNLYISIFSLCRLMKPYCISAQAAGLLLS